MDAADVQDPVASVHVPVPVHVVASPSHADVDAVITDTVNKSKRNIIHMGTVKVEAVHHPAQALVHVHPVPLALVLARHVQVAVRKVSLVIHSIRPARRLQARNQRIVVAVAVTRNTENPENQEKNQEGPESQSLVAHVQAAAPVPAVQAHQLIVELANVVPPVHLKGSSRRLIYPNASIKQF